MILGLQSFNSAYNFSVNLPATPAIGTKVFFPDVSQVFNKIVQGFCVFLNDTSLQTIEGNNSLTLAASRSIFVTLVDENNFKFVDSVPLSYFNLLTYGQPIRQFVPERKLKVTSCYFEFAALVAGLPVNCTFFYND